MSTATSMHADPPAQPNTANILLTAMTNLADMVNNLVAAMFQMQPSINALITQSTLTNTTTETLVEAIEKGNAKKSKVAYDAPDKYDGTPENAVPFCQACAFYFEAKGEEEHKNKIIFALSKVRGGTNNMATIWANQQRKLILDNPAVYADWNAFATALYEHFSLQNDEAEAIHAIRTMDMGTGSAEDYTTVFKTYQTRCGYNNVALIEEYRRGLKKSLEERC